MTNSENGTTNARASLQTPPKDGLNLRYLFLVLWRQKIIIAATTVLLTAMAVFALSALQPEYTATARVVLEPREENVVKFESVAAGLPVDTSAVQTEQQILTSRGLASQVVDTLDLDRNPEFNVALRDPSQAPFFDRVRGGVKNLIAAVAGTRGASQAASSMAQQSIAVIDAFGTHLSVDATGESRAIDISFMSWDPVTAANAANTLAEHYVADRVEAKAQEAERANKWLSQQLAALRKSAEESQRAAQAYRSESGLLLGDREVTLPTKEVSRLTDELVKAKAMRADAEAKLLQAKKALKSGGNIDAVPEVIDSALVQALRQDEIKLSADLAQMSQIYGQNHPLILPVQQKLQEVRRSIGVETQRVLRGLESQVNAARETEKGLTDNLEAMKRSLGASNKAEGELQILEAEATANQSLFDTFLQRYKETGAEGSMHVPDVRIVSRADIPLSPSFPKKLQILALSLIAAVGLGIGLAFVNESLDDTIRSMDQAEAGLGVPALGLVPALGRSSWRLAPARYVLKHPQSAFAESLHRLYSGVMLSGGEVKPRLILLTSSLPNEGKTTIAVSLGRLLALGNRKVIVVDADLRNPGVHKIVGVSGKRGLADCVAGSAMPEEAIQRDPKSTLDILPAGRIGNNATRIVESDRLAPILRGLAQTYDVVLIDAAPVFAVSDACLMSRMVDRTVYLVRWGRTRREVAAAGLKQLRDAGAHVAGALVTRVNIRRHALYGFADSGTYHRQLARYYVG